MSETTEYFVKCPECGGVTYPDWHRDYQECSCEGKGFVPAATVVSDPPRSVLPDREVIAKAICRCVFVGMAFDQVTQTGQSSCLVAADAVIAILEGLSRGGAGSDGRPVMTNATR